MGKMEARIQASRIDDDYRPEPLKGSFFDPNSNDFPTSKALQRRLGIVQSVPSDALTEAETTKAVPGQSDVGQPVPPTVFTDSERSLIARINGLMTADALLALLNERLIAGGTPAAAAHTMEQIRNEISRLAKVGEAVGGENWAGLRKLLISARKAGTLAKITPQLIDDFAVVFSLTTKQVVALKDIVLGDKEISDEA